MIGALTKVCVNCAIEKPWSDFHAHANTGRPRSRCKPCLRAYNRTHRNPANHAPRESGWLRARRSDPTLKEKHKLAKYNMTPAQYVSMYAQQNGVCAICREPETVAGKTLAVDHCHTSGNIRGLLCNRCNLLLGKAHDKPSVLDSAAAYLRAWGC